MLHLLKPAYQLHNIICTYIKFQTGSESTVPLGVISSCLPCPFVVVQPCVETRLECRDVPSSHLECHDLAGKNN